MVFAKNLRYDIESLIYDDDMKYSDMEYDIESLEYFRKNNDDFIIEITNYYDQNDDFIIEINDVKTNSSYFNKIRGSNYSDLFDNERNDSNEYFEYLTLFKVYLFKFIF
jgi:hypothetical protein